MSKIKHPQVKWYIQKSDKHPKPFKGSLKNFCTINNFSAPKCTNLLNRLRVERKNYCPDQICLNSIGNKISRLVRMRRKSVLKLYNKFNHKK